MSDEILQPTIKRRRMHFLEHGAGVDCSFIVGTEPTQEVIKAHTLFLVTASPVFEAMFHGEMAEKSPIIVPDIQPDVFKALLEYLYTAKVDLRSSDEVCGLLYAAKKYMLPELMEYATKYFESNLSTDETFHIYEFGKLIENKQLMDYCVNRMRLRTQDLLDSASFGEAKLETVITLFEQPRFNIRSEVELLCALERFALKFDSRGNSTDKNLKNSLTVRNALMKIRFLTLTPQEFSGYPVMSSLLTETEKLSILRNICDNCRFQPKYQMPEGFSLSTTRRCY